MPESEEIFTYMGDFEITNIIVANSSSAVSVRMPSDLSLGAAYPNPFNPSTTIDLYVPMEGNVNVQVYDLSGRAVQTLLSGVQPQGDYNLTWNATDVASGMYLIRAEMAERTVVKKVLLLFQ